MRSKIIFAVLYLIFIMAALFNGGVPTLVQLMIIVGYFYVYAVFTNKKALFYITLILLLLLSILTCLGIYIDYAMPAISNGYSKFGEGFLCFVAAFICLIINIFIPIKKDSEEEKKENKVNDNNEKLLKKSEDKDHKYIFATYVSGFKSIPSMSPCSVVYDSYNKQLYFYIVIDDEKVNNYNISCDCIKNININKQILFSTSTKKPVNNELANFLLLSTLNVYWGGYLAESSLFNTKGNNEKTEFYDNYEIVITYLYNNEDKKIFLKTDFDPNEFFSLVKSYKE